MLEGPGVHFVNKQDDAPLESHYVACQKNPDVPRMDLTAQSKAANLLLLCLCSLTSLTLFLCVCVWNKVKNILTMLCIWIWLYYITPLLWKSPRQWYSYSPSVLNNLPSSKTWGLFSSCFYCQVQMSKRTENRTHQIRLTGCFIASVINESSSEAGKRPLSLTRNETSRCVWSEVTVNQWSASQPLTSY